jgi:hypothetical protein
VVLEVVVRVLVASVAISAHGPVLLIVSAENVAVPAIAATDVTPPRVHVDEIVTVSLVPIPVVSTFPFTSSTATEKDVNTDPAVVTVAGGGTIKAKCVGTPGVSAIVELVAAVRAGFVASVATMLQTVPLVMMTALKVDLYALPCTSKVPPRTHDVDERTIVSVASAPDVSGMPLLSSTATVNGVRTVPALTVV